MKQETLEEAAHKMLMDFGIMSVGESINVLNVKKLMVLFAKEQKKRMYSDEEAIEFFIEGYRQRAIASNLIFDNTSRMYAISLFEQFKKK
jgi:hypothetical protein